MNSSEDEHSGSTEAEHHLAGEGHAHHRFDPGHAEKFHDPARLRALSLRDLTATLDVQSGDVIIDLGTGSGACLPELSRAVAPDGRVVGMDISQSMLNQAQSHITKHGLDNVELVKNEPDNVPRPNSSTDAVLIISSLHEFSDPLVMLTRIREVLKPDGRLGIVEWSYEETDSGPPLDHRLPPATVEEWLSQAGFSLETHTAWTDDYDLYVAVPDRTDSPVV